MSEYAEQEWEDEDDDLLDEIDELEEALEIADINSQIRDLERAHGAAFSQAEIDQIGSLIDEGYDPQTVYEHVAPTHPGEQAFDNRFIETVEHLTEQQGRPLQQSEVDRLYESARYEGDARHVAPDALRDLSKKADRISHINEKIAEPAEVPETVEPLAEDATSQDRIDYMNARHGGAQVEDTDSYEIGEE